MLFAACVVALALNAGAQPALPDTAKTGDFVGNTQCKVCHNKKEEGQQWDAWKKMAHATAFTSLQSDKAKEIAAKRSLAKPAHESPECLACHVTGYDPAKAAAPAKIKLEDGVQCESCHGPSSLHIKDGQALKMHPEKVAEVDMKAHRVVPDEAMCKACHNDKSPTWDPARYALDGGQKAGFDYKQALAKIQHGWPEGVIEKKYEGKYKK